MDAPGYATVGGRALRVVVGVFDGFGSALTGTSGPVILLPVLIGLRWDILDALGSAQSVQAPIALAATVAYVTLRCVAVVPITLYSSRLLPRSHTLTQTRNHRFCSWGM